MALTPNGFRAHPRAKGDVAHSARSRFPRADAQLASSLGLGPGLPA
jgi:hypothetical protein